MKANEAKEATRKAVIAFDNNEDYLVKVLDKIRKLAECGIPGVIIQYQWVGEHDIYAKVEAALEMLGYDVELYSDYLQVKWG